MEDQDNIIGHPLLCNEYFFTSIDDEVAALVEYTLLRIVGYFQVIQTLQVTEVGTDHHRTTTNQYVRQRTLLQYLFDLLFSFFACFFNDYHFRRFKFKFPDIDVNIDFSRVGETSDTRFMREDRSIRFICLQYTGSIVHVHLGKLDIPTLVIPNFFAGYILILYG